MDDRLVPRNLQGFPVHMVGIKGTGMASLAELFHRLGARVTGSDRPEKFYTDVQLSKLGISYAESFRSENLPQDTRLVVYSTAYSPTENPELRRAAATDVPVLTYPQALGELSRRTTSTGITGVHGKTTTTALVGTLVKALGMPASVIAGSAVASFGDGGTIVQGDHYFVAETCEYQRHFLDFHPSCIILTNAELDHPDYFADEADVRSAFVEYALRLSRAGRLIYCADDPGARAVADEARGRRPDLRLIPYGRNARGRFAVTHEQTAPGEYHFSLSGIHGSFALRVPGAHNVLNAAAAVAWAATTMEEEGARTDDAAADRIAEGLAAFRGSRRRSEVVGEAGGILFMDDYAHHPTAIRTTIAGLRAFYGKRRIVADFMPHTFSRTRRFLAEFASCFGDADELVLHDIYASAREHDPGDVSGRDLYRRAAAEHPYVVYFPKPLDAWDWCVEHLRPGDLFVTLGAGDNWRLGRRLYDTLRKGGS